MGHPCIVITQNAIDLSLVTKCFKNFGYARAYIGSLFPDTLFSKRALITDVKTQENQSRYNYICGYFTDDNSFITLLNAVIIEERESEWKFWN